MSSYMPNVCHPDFIWYGRTELALQPVWRHDMRFTFQVLFYTFKGMPTKCAKWPETDIIKKWTSQLLLDIFQSWNLRLYKSAYGTMVLFLNVRLACPLWVGTCGSKLPRVIVNCVCFTSLFKNANGSDWAGAYSRPPRLFRLHPGRTKPFNHLRLLV